MLFSETAELCHLIKTSSMGSLGPFEAPITHLAIQEDVELDEDDEQTAELRTLAAKRGRHRLHTATPSPVGSAPLVIELWRV